VRPVPDLPQRSCPIGVRLLELEVEEREGPFQASALDEFPFISEPEPPKLQVDWVRPRELSEFDEDCKLTLLVALERAFMSIGGWAIEPGVKFGSSSGFFMPGPFHGLPGSNSGIPNESRPLETESPPDRPDEVLEVSGHPLLLPEGVQGLSSKGSPDGLPGLPGPAEEAPGALEKADPSSGNFQRLSRDLFAGK